MLNLKKMGFDINIIKDKNLRKELISLLTIYLDEYEIYDKPYERNMFKTNPISNQELNLKLLINLANKDRHKNEIIDISKKCFTCGGYKIDGGIPYNFDVIYDCKAETYKILGYPIVNHLITHNNFSGSFSIIYDNRENSLQVNKYSRNFEYGLSLESHSYKYSENNLYLLSNYKEYYGQDVIKMEKSYMEKFKYVASNIYVNGNINFISHIKPQSNIIFLSSKGYGIVIDSDGIYESPIYDEIVIIEGNNIDIKPLYRKNKSLILNEIIAYDKYQKEKRISKQKKYGYR